MRNQELKMEENKRAQRKTLDWKRRQRRKAEREVPLYFPSLSLFLVEGISSSSLTLGISTIKNRSMTSQQIKPSKRHMYGKRKSAPWVTWKSANSPVQQWCWQLRNRVLGENESALWRTRIIASIRPYVPRWNAFCTYKTPLSPPAT